jgi:sortase A
MHFFQGTNLRRNMAGVALLLIPIMALVRSAGAQNAAKPPDVNAGNPIVGAEVEPASDIDFTDWSTNRVTAYKESLKKWFPEPMATVRIPRLRIQAPLFEGTDDVTLDRGLGRIAGTAFPNESGNVGIAGHRDGFFRPLKDIRVGDTIDVETFEELVRYQVDRIDIVTPSNVEVLRAGSKATLTLITCYPFYFVGHAPQRFVVTASLLQRTAIPAAQQEHLPSEYASSSNKK